MTETRSPDLREQAISWQLLLNDNPHDSGVRRQLEAWCAESPQHRQAWERAERVRAFARLAIEAEPAAPLSAKSFEQKSPHVRLSGIFSKYVSVCLAGGPVLAGAGVMVFVS